MDTLKDGIPADICEARRRRHVEWKEKQADTPVADFAPEQKYDPQEEIDMLMAMELQEELDKLLSEPPPDAVVARLIDPPPRLQSRPAPIGKQVLDCANCRKRDDMRVSFFCCKCNTMVLTQLRGIRMHGPRCSNAKCGVLNPITEVNCHENACFAKIRITRNP